MTHFMRIICKGSQICVIVIVGMLTTMSLSQTTFAIKNPVALPPGAWIMNTNGGRQVLNLTSILPNGEIEGTLTAYQSGVFPNWVHPVFYQKIFGFWDADAWKITFLAENTVFWIDHVEEKKHPLNCNTVDTKGQICHHRDQIFTGYMFGGLPCQSLQNKTCTDGGNAITKQFPITMAGSFEAWGTGSGTGATADRNVFGWLAVHQAGITQVPCTCGSKALQ
jgi:hypothetical protein